MIVAFDLDGTLCDSGKPVGDELRKFLLSLENVAIVSGARKENIVSRVGEGFYVLAQSGNDVYAPNGLGLWRNEIPLKKKHEILTLAPEGHVQDRGCQISVSLVGHDAPWEIKRPFDPTGEKRRKFLKNVPEGVVASIGGTTCIDYTLFSKGDNLKRLMTLLKEECIYFGDQLFSGGNDESVMGVCPVIAVQR